MLGFVKKAFFYGCLVLTGCSQVDDYLLGKDNTIKPKALPDYHQKITFKSLWTSSVGKTEDAAHLKLTPAVYQHVIYIADSKGRVSALNKETGKSIWVKQVSSSPLSGPVVSEDILALGTDNASVLVLSREDGHVIWEASVSGDVLASPLITQKRVIVKTIDGRLYAFDKYTGKKLWSLNHGSPNLILRASSSPIKVGNWVIVGFSDGKLDAIELDTGRVLWQRSIAYASGSSDVERLVDIDTDPVAEGHHLFLASYQGDVGMMSMKTGEFIWHKPTSTYDNLTLDDRALYVVDSSDVIIAMNKKNGQTEWKQTALRARGATSAAQLGRYLLIADKTGYLHGLDIQQGELVGRVSLNAPIDVAPVVSDGRVYVLTQAGQLTCFAVER